MISLYYNLIPMPTMPIPSEIEIQLSEQLKTKIIQSIHSNQGWISFDRFWNLHFMTLSSVTTLEI